MSERISATEAAKLTGRTALVTGAFSGFGLHFSRVLAAHGAKVAMAGRRIELGCTLAAEIGEASARPGDVRAFAMDVTDAASVAGAMAAIVAELGAPAIVVNNAGIPARAPSLELSEAQWQGALDVNLSGVFRVAQASAREMVRAGTRGTIINIASILGLRVRAQVAAYAASTYRVVYTARLAEIVVVLHAFQKKTQATPKREIELARERWVQLQKER